MNIADMTAEQIDREIERLEDAERKLNPIWVEERLALQTIVPRLDALRKELNQRAEDYWEMVLWDTQTGCPE